jgi:hypothetical protein
MTISKSYILYLSSKKKILTERKGLCDLFWISPRTVEINVAATFRRGFARGSGRIEKMRLQLRLQCPLI